MRSGGRLRDHRNTLRALVSGGALFVAQDAAAQTFPPPPPPEASHSPEAIEGGEIVVTGARAVQRDSIAAKRAAKVISDGIIYEETGPLADNSIADIIERITGATADRFKGNANEVSVRGLGPTLSLATLNGQELSTAGPDRSVAFQQFPAELIHSVMVYKSPRADMLEGGIAGTLELQTFRPLEVDGRRIQAEIRGSYSPQDDRISGRSGTGYRGTLSYVDSWSTSAGEIGLALGVQFLDQSAPEDFYTTNSAFVPCNTNATGPAGAGLNCALADAPRNAGETVGEDYFATQSRAFRLLVTDEERDSALGTVQWRPSSEIELILDGQYSSRRSGEERKTFAIAEGLRGISPVMIGDGSNGVDEGVLAKFGGISNLESQFEDRQRNEEYIGASGKLEWTGDALTIAGAVSYSGSRRTETQKATRLRSDMRVAYEYDGTLDAVPDVAFTDFDITDPDRFIATAANSAYARRRLVTDRHDEIMSGQIDGTYRLDGLFVTSVKGGARYAEHDRTNDNAANSDLNTLLPLDGRTPAQLIAQANSDCRTGFPASDFMSGSSTSIRSWAVFDNDCLFRTFTGSDDALPYPIETRDPSDVDVSEKTLAAYVLAEFESAIGNSRIIGDFGVRYVSTRVHSTGYRLPVVITVNTASNEYLVAPDPDGEVNTTELSGSYAYWLPSANAAIELDASTMLRLAAYRAISRSPIEMFGSGIRLDPSSGTGVDAINFSGTTGNPGLKPMRAWNLDGSLEFYVNQDTAFSGAVYYKWLSGAVINAVAPIATTIEATTIVNGGSPVQQDYAIALVAPANDEETRHVYGVEVQGSHAFTYLPPPFDGFGVRAGYNLALSNFEYPDTSDLAPFLDPAGLIGLSKHALNGVIYWEKSGFSLSAAYRYRSGYFKPNSNTNRSVRGSGYLNLAAQYDFTRQLQVRLQVLNATKTRDVLYKGVYDNVTEVSESGRILYLGVRVRL